MKINLQARCDSIRTDFLSVAIIGPVGASQMKLNPITDDIMNRIHQKMSWSRRYRRSRKTTTGIMAASSFSWSEAFLSR